MAPKKRKGRQPQSSPGEEAAEAHVKRNKSLEEPAEPDHEDKSEQEQQDPPQKKYASEEESDDEEEVEEKSDDEEEVEEESDDEEEEEEEEEVDEEEAKEEEESDDEEEIEEEEEKENEPVPKPTETKPAESAGEEDEGGKGEEKEEVVFKQANEREYESAKKKQKIDASPSQPSGKFSRIWSYDDELKLMQALFQFHCEQGRPPKKNEYGLFHKSLKNLNPAIQDTQVRNKVRTFRDAHSAWKRRGTPPFPPSNPNAEALFEMSKKMWGENVEVPTKVEEVVHDTSDDEEVVEAKNINGTNTINGEQNVKNKSKFPYVKNAIKELAEKDGNLLVWKNSFKMMENSKAEKFEAKFKKQKYNQAKSFLKDLKLATEFVKELTDLAK